MYNQNIALTFQEKTKENFLYTLKFLSYTWNIALNIRIPDLHLKQSYSKSRKKRAAEISLQPIKENIVLAGTIEGLRYCTPLDPTNTSLVGLLAILTISLAFVAIHRDKNLKLGDIAVTNKFWLRTLGSVLIVSTLSLLPSFITPIDGLITSTAIHSIYNLLFGSHTKYNAALSLPSIINGLKSNR